MLSVANLDEITVNVKDRTVQVGAGARVSTVLTELAKYGLTLENFSSIQEQQIGGWTQVSAHGTGISLPPVDEMIVAMEIATPTEGLLSFTKDDIDYYKSKYNSPEINQNPEKVVKLSKDSLFRLCKVGLGCLGVVTKLTLKCIPQLDLVEHTLIKDRKSICEGHVKRLQVTLCKSGSL